MGREVRRVPADWEHPKHSVPDWRTGQMIERYKPLFPGENYQARVDEWDAECAKWKAGWRPDYCTDPESIAMCYEQWNGQRPHRDDYMPNWPVEQRTHLMMYEDTSEGTPISPAFETPDELARWLVDNKASAFGSETASYEGWLPIESDGEALRKARGDIAYALSVAAKHNQNGPGCKAPAPVLPLSDEHIDKIREALVEKMMAAGMLVGDDAWDHSLARAIERAHSIAEPGAGGEG